MILASQRRRRAVIDSPMRCPGPVPAQCARGNLTGRVLIPCGGNINPPAVPLIVSPEPVSFNVNSASVFPQLYDETVQLRPCNRCAVGATGDDHLRQVRRAQPTSTSGPWTGRTTSTRVPTSCWIAGSWRRSGETIGAVRHLPILSEAQAVSTV